jgi:hypothetical protein
LANGVLIFLSQKEMVDEDGFCFGYMQRRGTAAHALVIKVIYLLALGWFAIASRLAGAWTSAVLSITACAWSTVFAWCSIATVLMILAIGNT